MKSSMSLCSSADETLLHSKVERKELTPLVGVRCMAGILCPAACSCSNAAYREETIFSTREFEGISPISKQHGHVVIPPRHPFSPLQSTSV